MPGVVDAVKRQAAVETSQAFEEYGDPRTTPIVSISSNGDLQIVLDVGGITCEHCVKIVESVLRGCPDSKSPISDL